MSTTTTRIEVDDYARQARLTLVAAALHGILAASATKVPPDREDIARDAVKLGDATFRKLMAGRSAMEAEAWQIVEGLAALQFGVDVDRFELGHLVARARGVLEVKKGGGS